MSFTVPNLLSFLRMGLIPIFVIALIEGRAKQALIIMGVAGVTDLLDGLIARFFNQQSALGAFLDPMADKLLLVSAYVTLAVPSLDNGMSIPLWISAMVITRDIIIVVVAAIMSLVSGVKRFPPMMISKVTTVAQVLGVLAVLVAKLHPELEGAAAIVLYIVAGLTLLSGLMYIHHANQLTAGKI